jgi:hypothetical protein
MPDTAGAVELSQQPQQPAPPQEQPQEAPEITYPPGLAEEYYPRFRQFLELQAENNRNEEELAKRYRAGIDQSSIVGLRFQTFLEVVWPRGTPEGELGRLAHDIAYQQELATKWTQLREAAIQHRLAQGAQLSQDEITIVQQIQSRQGAPGLFGNPG